MKNEKSCVTAEIFGNLISQKFLEFEIPPKTKIFACDRGLKNSRLVYVLPSYCAQGLHDEQGYHGCKA